MVPWFTHDALIHYLSPRGLEQYTGGAWGTRDVSQGPVGLLLTLGAHAELRSLVMLIMQAQNARGDWPQAFDFLERHRSDGQSGSHGDVVYWPLLALGQYLAATGDGTILAEQLSFTGDDGPTAPASMADHVRARARPHRHHLDRRRPRCPRTGTATGTTRSSPPIPNSPPGSARAGRWCCRPTRSAPSAPSWTGTKQTRDLGQRAVRTAEAGVADLRRLLLVDGVLAGYGLFGTCNRPSTGSGHDATSSRWSR